MTLGCSGMSSLDDTPGPSKQEGGALYSVRLEEVSETHRRRYYDDQCVFEATGSSDPEDGQKGSSISIAAAASLPN